MEVSDPLDRPSEMYLRMRGTITSGEEVSSVHPVQLVDLHIPSEPFDMGVDGVFTPSTQFRVNVKHDRPRDLLWEYVTEDLMEEIPLLREVRK